MNLKGFVKECHKKGVFKMLSIYIVSSWVVLQVLALITSPLGLPEKSVTYLIVILLFGFPIYIYYVWKFRLLKHEIQQTEDPTTPYNKSAFQKMYFSSLFVIGLLSGIAITLIFKNNFGEKISLKKLKGNDKIAVLDFENTTGNTDLDNVGRIAARYISHGITENEVGQVISSKIVSDYTSIIKSQAGKSIDLNNLLKNYLKPGKVIEGTFYMEKDTLFLQGSIKDGLVDKTLISFETIKCDPNAPLDCAEKLKQDVLGYLSTEDRQDESGYIKKNNNQVASYYEETPPNYVAYQYLINALDNIENDKIHLEYLNKAIKNDLDFFEPKTHLMAYYYNKGLFSITDSLIKTVATNSTLNARQKNWMLFYESIISGKNDKTYRAIKKEYDVASLDMNTNQTTMTIALQYVNRPEEVDAIYNEIPMEDMVLDNCTRCGFRYYVKGLADVELGNYNNVIKILAPATNIIEANYLKRPLLSAYVKSGKIIELEKYLSHYALTASNEDMDYLNVFTGMQFLNANQKSEADTYFNKVISNSNATTAKPNLAKAYYYKGDYTNAEDLYKSLHETEPHNIEYLVLLAISYFKNGHSEAAKTHIEKLNGLRTNYQFGAIDYGWAQYHASMGDKDKAIEFLKKSVAQGFNYTPTTFQHDYHFKTIKNTPEFINQIMNFWKNKTI
ncbi:tetratricopeptide repeat protein [Gelatiniphilus marinus]|uniref:Tetratricopeptide repeat protein n=1 Tax=Gelatiniphilus marinus TaxID=1759464 RepID=A0ABW5JS56_9FLAO